MSEEILHCEIADRVALLTLNRPKALNALSAALRSELMLQFEALIENPDVAAIILTGAGRAFCAGLDLKELASGLSTVKDPLVSEGQIVRTLWDCPKPIIGAINGFAITGGFELALACDVLIASTDASFADTHARVGLMPGWGLSQRLPRLIGIGRAKELSFTGNYLKAETAVAWGLVNRIVEPDQLLPVCKQLAQDMLSCDSEVLKNYKRVIDQGYALTLAEGIQVEATASKQQYQGITAQKIGARREKVKSRGREQQA